MRRSRGAWITKAWLALECWASLWVVVVMLIYTALDNEEIFNYLIYNKF
jgi:hypothetical protein